MKTFKLLIFGAPFFLAASVTGLRVAQAHSFPEQETPSAGQRLSAPPSEVAIKFDAPIEKLFAKLEVVDTDGKAETTGPPQVDPTALTLSVKVAALKPIPKGQAEVNMTVREILEAEGIDIVVGSEHEQR